MIYSLGLRLFKHEEDARDFVQDVYLHSHGKKSKYSGLSKFSTWLYSVALNLGLNRIKKNKKLLTDTMPEDFPENIDSVEDSVLSLLIRDEVNDRVRVELNELPDAYRISLVLYYFEGLSYSEIARKLAQKEGTVKSNLHRAKAIMRDKLAGYYGR